jgi:hypothetical protein
VIVQFQFLTLITLVTAAAAAIGCSRESPEARFWAWFQNNQKVLFDFEQNQEQTFDLVAAEMHRVDPALTFEFGPKRDGRREFTISADGIRKAFPKVESLFAAAPSLPRWKFSKYRQRAKPLDLAYEGISIKADAVVVRVDRDGTGANVTMFLPGYSPGAQQKYESIAFLLLERALGEYDAGARVAKVQVAPTKEAPAEAYSLDTLPRAFDALFGNRDKVR